MAESEEELKSFLMKVNKESKNVGLKLNIHNTKVMASSSTTSLQRWGNDGTSERLYFAGTPISLQVVTATLKLTDTYFLEEEL